MEKLETVKKENDSLNREIFDLKERLAEVNTELVKIKNAQHFLEGKFSKVSGNLSLKDDVLTGHPIDCHGCHIAMYFLQSFRVGEMCSGNGLLCLVK